MKNSRRLLILLGAGLVIWTSAFGQVSGQDPVRGKIPTMTSFTPPKLWERVEITVFGGLGVSILRWTTLHYSESTSEAGLLASAENRIKTTASPGFFAGAGATFFLKSGIGIQAGFGYLKSGLESENVFRYAARGGTPAAYTASARGEGELTAVPVFLCLFNKMDVRLGKKTIRTHLAAGPALFLNSVLTQTTAGAALSREEKTDAFLIPVSVADTTWIILGATAGVGLDIPITPSLALALEGRYFYAPRKNVRWSWTPGIYDGAFREIAAFDFDAAAAGRQDGDTTYLTVDPSFVQIACGLKLIF